MIKKQTTTSIGEDMKLEPSSTIDGNVKPCSCSEKIVREFLKKSKIEIPYDPVLPVLGIYPRELKSGSQKGIYTPTFAAAYSQ